jgi:hypothetical protein
MILKHQPRKDLAFWSSPRSPHRGRHDGNGKTLKLHLVSRGGGVCAATGELPNNRIGHVIGKMDVGYALSKLCELGNMLNCKAMFDVDLRNPKVVLQGLSNDALFLQDK